MNLLPVVKLFAQSKIFENNITQISTNFYKQARHLGKGKMGLHLWILLSTKPIQLKISGYSWIGLKVRTLQKIKDKLVFILLLLGNKYIACGIIVREV